MAYKFQLGAAVMSGSLQQEEGITTTDFSGSGYIKAAGDLTTAGAVKFDGVADTAVAVGADSFYFKDADGQVKSDTLADYATAAAGPGLSAASGVYTVNVDDFGVELNADTLRLKNNGVTLAKMAGVTRGSLIVGDASGNPSYHALGTSTQFMISDGDDPVYRTMSGDATLGADGLLTISADAVHDTMLNDDVAVGLAGVGLSAASGVLAIEASGAVKVSSDKVGISGSFAGNGLSYGGGVDSISTLAVNVDGSGIEINSDTLRLKDNGVTLAKMAGITRGSIISGDASGDPQALAVGSAHQFLQSDGTDLAYVSMSGDATLAAGVLTISADAVHDGMVNDDVATGLAGDGLSAASGVMAVNVDDSGIETNADTLRLKDNGVTLAKMAGLARGKFIIGDASGNPSALALGSSAQFPVSDGDDLIYRSMSGDATLGADGLLTISADAVHDGMVNDDVATGLAGLGLSAASGVLAVEVTGAVRITSDKVGLSGSFAGNGLSYGGGVDSIATLAVNVDGTGIEINSDSLRLKDNGVTLAKMAGITRGSFIIGDASGDPSALALGSAAQFPVSDGDDLIYRSMSGDATLGADGLLTISADAIHDGMVNDDVATGLAGDGLSAASGVLALDLSELSAAAIAVSADSFAFIDATDGSTKKESIADLVTAMAGGGLTATNGVLSVQSNDVATFADANATLAEGMNYGSASLTADRTLTLPAAPSVGDVIHVKAPASLGGFDLIIARGAGAHSIDGEASISLESNYGAVSLMYVAANLWKVW